MKIPCTSETETETEQRQRQKTKINSYSAFAKNVFDTPQCSLLEPLASFLSLT